MRKTAKVAAILGLVTHAVTACTGQIGEKGVETDPVDDVETSSDDGSDPDAIVVDRSEAPTPLLQAQVEDILNRNCGSCHGAEGTLQAGMDYIEDIEQLVASGRIVPGNPDASLVVQRVVSGSMPPAGNARPTDDEIAQIVAFVRSMADAGAGEGIDTGLSLAQCDDPLITFDEVFERIQEDLLAEDPDARRFVRYIGLTNRLNAGRCSAQLESDRWALSKLLNSLSVRPRVVVPEAIDEQEVIYRIDLRDYGWDDDVSVDGRGFDDGWEAIIAATDYAVPFEGDEADIAVRFTETDVPFLYADALMHAASSGNLYYSLARVPDALDELLDDLGIDVEDNRDRGFAARAATTQSGISREERVVERHDVNVGAGRVFWQSFEFAPGGGGSDIFVRPLDLDPGETEVIYSQPNGLHAYASFDEDGDRIEESNLLFDTLQEDFAVRSAVSCMTCHSRGLLQVRDEVRSFVESQRRSYSADDFQAVQELYPTIDQMDGIIETDRQVYQAALTDAGVPLDVTDPVSGAYLRFDGRVTLADVAGDLAVEPEELELEINRLDPRLRPVVERNDLQIARNQFENVFAESLCIMQVVSRNHPADDFCRNVLD
jgi:serine/threonine-protein kinase